MSRIIRALEKAEREKRASQDNDIFAEILSAEKPIEEKRPPRIQLEREPEIVPILPVESEVIPLVLPDSFAAEQIRKIKTFLFTRGPRNSHFILITSALPGEGKTTVAMNLAISISHEINKKAVLIDADLRKPNIFPGKYPLGICDYILRGVPLREILYPEGDNLWIIPAGSPSPRAAELIGAKRMMDLKRELQQMGEDVYIILDSPPAVVSSEPMLLSEWVDGIILVIMSQKVSRPEMQRVIDALGREKFIGVVFNDKNLSVSKKYPYYSGYYRAYHKK